MISRVQKFSCKHFYSLNLKELSLALNSKVLLEFFITPSNFSEASENMLAIVNFFCKSNRNFKIIRYLILIINFILSKIINFFKRLTLNQIYLRLF